MIAQSAQHRSLRWSAVAVLLLLVIGCGDYKRITPRGGTDYMPLLDGRTLRYRITDEAGSSEYTMRLRYLGGTEYKIFEAEFDGIRTGGLEFLSHGDYVEAVTQYSPWSLDPRTAKSEFRQVWIDEAVEIGDGWTDEGTGTSTVFAGYETVTVLGGTFADCYKAVTEPLPELTDSIRARYEREEINTEMFETEMANTKLIVVRWFAHGVGLVREEIRGQDLVREFIAVEEEGTVFPPDTANTGNQTE